MKLSQLAYTRFKEGLTERRIVPGAFMSQAELAAAIDVPLGPLREAVQVLEAEGLLTVMPRSGIRIVKPDMALIRDAFQLRRILEREAAARFAEQGPSAVMAQIGLAHDLLGQQLESSPDTIDYWRATRALDMQLHETLIDGLRNPMISRAFRGVYLKVMLVRLDTQTLLTPVLIRRTLSEHMRIIDALLRHDAEGATAAVDEHLTQAMHRCMWL